MLRVAWIGLAMLGSAGLYFGVLALSGLRLRDFARRA
jgi:hypothetical protein